MSNVLSRVDGTMTVGNYTKANTLLCKMIAQTGEDTTSTIPKVMLYRQRGGAPFQRGLVPINTGHLTEYQGL